MNKLIEKITDRIKKEIPVYTGKAISIIQEEVKAYNEVKTNADRIRSMTDEELAEFISKYFSCEYECAARDKCGSDWDCKRATIDWLQSEAE